MAPSTLLLLLAPLLAGATLAVTVPSDVVISATNESLTVLAARGHIISTATVCPGFTFSQLGATGPKLSPNRHWILVDVLGPYEPGNVVRNHVIVQVTTGKFVTSPNFKAYLGVPSSLQPIAWASGERATLRYADGSLATVHDPPIHVIPVARCAAPTPR